MASDKKEADEESERSKVHSGRKLGNVASF